MGVGAGARAADWDCVTGAAGGVGTEFVVGAGVDCLGAGVGTGEGSGGAVTTCTCFSGSGV